MSAEDPPAAASGEQRIGDLRFDVMVQAVVSGVDYNTKKRRFKPP